MAESNEASIDNEIDVISKKIDEILKKVEEERENIRMLRGEKNLSDTPNKSENINPQA